MPRSACAHACASRRAPTTGVVLDVGRPAALDRPAGVRRSARATRRCRSSPNSRMPSAPAGSQSPRAARPRPAPASRDRRRSTSRWRRRLRAGPAAPSTTTRCSTWPRTSRRRSSACRPGCRTTGRRCTAAWPLWNSACTARGAWRWRSTPAELSARLVVCYTGAPRQSGINNWEITKRRIDGDAEVIALLRRDRRGRRSAMRAALERGDWAAAGGAWRASGRPANSWRRASPLLRSTRCLPAAKAAGRLGGQGVRCRRRGLRVRAGATRPPRLRCAAPGRSRRHRARRRGRARPG